jgi:hypothetical protein
MATQLIILLGGMGGKAPHEPVYFKLFQHPLNSYTMCAYALRIVFKTTIRKKNWKIVK